jgi:hypothetical protein
MDNSDALGTIQITLQSMMYGDILEVYTLKNFYVVSKQTTENLYQFNDDTNHKIYSFTEQQILNWLSKETIKSVEFYSLTDGFVILWTIPGFNAREKYIDSIAEIPIVDSQRPDDNCALCLNSLCTGLLCKFDNCSHEFHCDCLEGYLDFSRTKDDFNGIFTCPICRQQSRSVRNIRHTSFGSKFKSVEGDIKYLLRL